MLITRTISATLSDDNDLTLCLYKKVHTVSYVSFCVSEYLDNLDNLSAGLNWRGLTDKYVASTVNIP